MKTTAKILLSALAWGMIATGCKTDDLLTYTKSPDVYFYTNSAPSQYVDSTNVQFAFYGIMTMEYPVSIRVRITGAPVNYDRHAHVEATERSTAKAGVHYTLASDVLIPANSINGVINLVAKRTPDMLTTNLLLELAFKTSDDFTVDMGKMVINNATGKTVNLNRYRVWINDILQKPSMWDMGGNFGAFSRPKCILVCEINNIPPSYLDRQEWEGKTISLPEFRLFAINAQAYLNAQKQAGNIILDTDGNPMAMDPTIVSLFPELQ